MPDLTLKELVLALLKQGEGNDHGAPPEVHLHLMACPNITVHGVGVSTDFDNRTTVAANLTCPHLPDPCGFEYSDYGSLADLAVQYSRGLDDPNQHDGS